MTAMGGDIHRLVLGGAQFGLDYGITNTLGRIGPDEAAHIVAVAARLGVRQIDTARAYGDSEAAIGAVLRSAPTLRFRVITKLDPLAELAEDSSAALVASRVEASLRESEAKLGRQPLDAVMLHRAAHLSGWGGAVWRRLRELRRAGRILALGVSVQSVHELEQALEAEDLVLIQLPCNVLDWRWDEARSRLRAARRARGLEVHARSSLLQGLLTSEAEAHWARANVAQSNPVRAWLRASADEHAGGNLTRLCIDYVRAQDWIDGVVIGVASLAQLEENAAYFAAPSLSEAALHKIEAGRPRVAVNTLDPAQWRLAQ